MKPMADTNEVGVWSWVTIFAACCAAIAITEYAGVQQKWEDVIIFTVLLFTMLVLVFRPDWRRKSFWWELLMVFVLHAIAATVILQSVAIGPHGIPGLLMTGITIVEGMFIVVILNRRKDKWWRRTNSHNSQ